MTLQTHRMWTVRRWRRSLVPVSSAGVCKPRTESSSTRWSTDQSCSAQELAECFPAKLDAAQHVSVTDTQCQQRTSSEQNIWRQCTYLKCNIYRPGWHGALQFLHRLVSAIKMQCSRMYTDLRSGNCLRYKMQRTSAMHWSLQLHPDVTTIWSEVLCKSEKKCEHAIWKD